MEKKRYNSESRILGYYFLSNGDIAASSKDKDNSVLDGSTSPVRNWSTTAGALKWNVQVTSSLTKKRWQCRVF